MQTIKSFLQDRWLTGDGSGTALFDPTTGAEIARASTLGLDLRAALRHARAVGGPALRALSFAQRGELLDGLAKALHGARDRLIEASALNAGSPRGDAKFDIDGASATLAAYARIGYELGPRRFVLDGPMESLGRSPRFAGQHVKVPLRGVAIHINAFNFPCWGPAEKLACAFLAGMPVLTKPATSTALPTAQMAEVFVTSGLLPPGAFSFLGGSALDLLDHVTSQDVIAFTGSAATGARLRGHARVLEHSVRVNVEADSLNVMVVGPDVEPGDETWRLFIRELVRELAQKTGQKCTATRRVLLPLGRESALADAVTEELTAYRCGPPTEDGVRMGPLATAAQQSEFRDGLAALAPLTTVLCGTTRLPDGPGAFVAPVLLLAPPGCADPMVHGREVFGPVATVIPYDGSAAEASRLANLGDGSLVGSIYSEDLAFLEVTALEMAPYHGRLLLGQKRIAEHSTGPGLVLPTLQHGGPGRAGGGSELGGVRGLDLYWQRVAFQGARPVLERLLDARSSP